MKYVALLRGIGPLNPNMRNEKLCEVFEKLGFKNVQAVISTGNIIFETSSNDSKKLEEKIEKTISSQLGFQSATMVRSKDELQTLINKNPFKGIEDTPTSRLNVTFLKNKPTSEVAFPYEGKGYTVIKISDKELGSIIDLSGTKTPDVMRWLERQFSKAMTMRTWKTIMKIFSKL